MPLSICATGTPPRSRPLGTGGSSGSRIPVKIKLLSRIDTDNEIEYYKNGGILQFVLRNMI
mgnify:CR=1 FL=1